MSDQIISLIVFGTPGILVLIYFFGRWKVRRFIMRKFGEKIGLIFQEKDSKDFELKGDYKNKKVIISESSSTMIYGGAAGNVSSKILEIKVDEKIIYNKNGEVIFPLPGKIKRIIDNYIDKGILPKKYTLLKWIIVAMLFAILIISQIIMRNQ